MSKGDAIHSACFPQLHPELIASEQTVIDTPGRIKPISNDWRMGEVLARMIYEALFSRGNGQPGENIHLRELLRAPESNATWLLTMGCCLVAGAAVWVCGATERSR